MHNISVQLGDSTKSFQRKLSNIITLNALYARINFLVFVGTLQKDAVDGETCGRDPVPTPAVQSFTEFISCR